MKRSADLTIIGGGIVGVAHAYHALKAGLTVLLVEKDTAPRGATIRNFGQVVPSGMNSKWRDIGRVSLSFYKEIQKKVDLGMRQEGTLYIASDDEELQLIYELHEKVSDEGYSCQLMSKNDCLRHIPSLQKNYVEEGIFFPEEVVIDPRFMIHRMISYCVEVLGLHYHPNTFITRVESTISGVEVEDSHGQFYKSDRVLICTGSETKILFPSIFEESDLQLVKLQMIDTKPQSRKCIPGSLLTGKTIRRYESFAECPSYQSIKLKEDTSSFYNKHGVHILFKQGLDGSIVIGDSHHYFDVSRNEEVTFDISHQVNQFMIDEAKGIIQFEDFQVRNIWVGVYTQCKNKDLFHYEVADDITIVTGIGGKGMTAALGLALQNINRMFHLNTIV